MSSTHRSAMGKPVDMAAIRSRNEDVRAVGNMRVNARGDEIDSNNNIVTNSNRRVNQSYSRTTVNPSARVRGQSPEAQNKTIVPDDEPIVLSQAELDLEQELENEIVPEKPKDKSKK